MIGCPRVSIIIIGRNESRTLSNCIDSVCSDTGGRRDIEVIYVDSGSEDESVEIARAHKVIVIQLCRASAAMARNHGWRRAQGELLLFLDGDMTLVPGWLAMAEAKFKSSSVAGVAGHIVEDQFEASVFDRAFGLDWSRAVGDVQAIGGAGMWRRELIAEAKGFDESLSFGEDPDLSHRIRKKGWRIVQLDMSMVIHSLQISGFSGWWRRALNVGKSTAIISAIHPDVTAPRRRLFRAARDVLAVISVLVAALLASVFVCLPLLWITCLLVRQFLRDRSMGHSLGDAFRHAIHIQLIKLPLLLGAAQYLKLPPKGALSA